MLFALIAISQILSREIKKGYYLNQHYENTDLRELKAKYKKDYKSPSKTKSYKKSKSTTSYTKIKVEFDSDSSDDDYYYRGNYGRNVYRGAYSNDKDVVVGVIIGVCIVGCITGAVCYFMCRKKEKVEDDGASEGEFKEEK